MRPVLLFALKNNFILLYKEISGSQILNLYPNTNNLYTIYLDMG